MVFNFQFTQNKLKWKQNKKISYVLDTEKVVFLPLRRFRGKVLAPLQGAQIDKKQTNKMETKNPEWNTAFFFHVVYSFNTHL